MAWAVLFAVPAGATVLDFETLANGRVSTAGRPASNEYAPFGVIFTGGSTFPGQPAFRGWSSFSKLVAKQPPPNNRFLIVTTGQDPDEYLDIVMSFTTPMNHVEGDVVFNPSVSAMAIAYDASHRAIFCADFAAGSENWIAGRFSFESTDGIASIVLRASSPGVQMGLDNLMFVAVPEPSRLALLLAGIVCIAIAATRARGTLR
jgi:hypothetical protein